MEPMPDQAGPGAMDDIRRFLHDYQDSLDQAVAGSGMPLEITSSYQFEGCISHKEGRQVYFVQRQSDGQKAVLRVSEAGSGEDVAREGEILAQLRHPDIPTVLGVWREGGRSYLVREYFDGTPLNEYAKRRKGLSAGEIIGVLLQYCDILAYLHSRQPPVVHRDIKPENTIMADDGRLKLIDFGISRQVQPGADRDTTIVGTRPYMAPEQFGSEQTDARADIYSLGVVIIFLATLHTDKEHLDKNFPYKQLLPVVKKCIRKDRARRYRSVEKLRKKLLRIQRHTARKAVLAAATAALVLGATVGGYYTGLRQGFGQGVDWLMSSPSPTIKQYTAEQLYQPIYFEDEKIEFAVRNVLNKDIGETVYFADLGGRLDQLHIFGSFIPHPSLEYRLLKQHHGLGDVEYFLEGGFMFNERGTTQTLVDLGKLYGLRDVMITSQSFADLSPLEGLLLERLVVCNNYVGNLLPLKDMATLRTLDVCQNPLDNLLPVSGLLSLESLDVSQTQVKDLSPLAGLTKLTQLQLNYCEATDLSALAGLTKLEALGVKGLAVADFGFLEQLTALTTLDLANTTVRDLSFAAKLPKLQWLDISHTAVTDLTPLLGRGETLNLTCEGIAGEVLDQVREDGNILIHSMIP